MFYNEDFNFFSEKHGTSFTNKKWAKHKAAFARKYARASNADDPIEVIEEDERYLLGKDVVIERMLNMFLPQEQINYIKENWKEFYEDPLKYKDSAMVDMVKQSLMEGIITNQEVKSLKEIYNTVEVVSVLNDGALIFVKK